MDATQPLREFIDSETCNKGVDVILMATPDLAIDNSLLKLLVPGGRICIFSGPKAGDHQVMIDVRSMLYRELTMVGAYGCSSRLNKEATELLASGALKVDWIITKRVRLENIWDAFDHSSERNGLKSVINGS
jgi:L-iditol 2-dehydrogenase